MKKTLFFFANTDMRYIIEKKRWYPQTVTSDMENNNRFILVYGGGYFFEFLQRATIATISIPNVIITLSIS